jgi:hypothetical protein
MGFSSRLERTGEWLVGPPAAAPSMMGSPRLLLVPFNQPCSANIDWVTHYYWWDDDLMLAGWGFLVHWLLDTPQHDV